MAESMSDPDLAALRQPVKAGVRRPEFVAAAAAARERELAATAQGAKSALPPAFVPPRPPVPSARLADLSGRGKPGAGRDPEGEDVYVANEPLPPPTPLVKPSSTKGKPSLLETIVRRNAARRGDSTSESSAATATAPRLDASGPSGEHENCDPRHDLPSDDSRVPPSPSLAGSGVRHRIAAVRSRFARAVADMRLPSSPPFDMLEDDNGESVEERRGKQNSANQAPDTPTRSTGRRLHSPRLASIPESRPRGSPNRSNHKQQASNSFDPNDPFVLSSVAPVANGKGTPVLSLRGQLAGESPFFASFTAARNFPGGAPSSAGPPRDSQSEGPRPGRHMREAEDVFGGDDDDDSDFVPEEDSDEVEEEFEGMGGLPLYEFDCLPEHLRESQDIMTGYRIEYSTIQCIRSIFAWHNDTVAIWTLLASSGLFSYLAFQNFAYPGAGLYNYPSDNNLFSAPADSYVIAGYCTLIAMSSLFSAAYDVFRTHKNRLVHNRLCLLDYNSFLVGTFALGFSVIHFSTSCDLALRHKLVLATSTVTAFGLWIPWTNAFYSGFFQRLHCYYYLMIIAPVMLMTVHSLYYPGSDMALVVFQDFWAPFLGVCAYLFGYWCYTERIPEARFPYRFDYFLNSQQIWNWCLFMSSYCAYCTLQQFAAFRATTRC